jgi:hypothetical protein
MSGGQKPLLIIRHLPLANVWARDGIAPPEK